MLGWCLTILPSISCFINCLAIQNTDYTSNHSNLTCSLIPSIPWQTRLNEKCVGFHISLVSQSLASILHKKNISYFIKTIRLKYIITTLNKPSSTNWVTAFQLFFFSRMFMFLLRPAMCFLLSCALMWWFPWNARYLIAYCTCVS